MERKTLSLRKPPDPGKLALSLQIGFRFVERKGNRYIQQVHVPAALVVFHREILPNERTWVDIPLVPETYGEAQA